MSTGEWVATVISLIVLFAGFVGWLAATFIRAGKILNEIKQMSTQVTTLAKAFDSQDRKLELHEIRLTKIESRSLPPFASIAGAM